MEVSYDLQQITIFIYQYCFVSTAQQGSVRSVCPVISLRVDTTKCRIARDTLPRGVSTTK